MTPGDLFVFPTKRDDVGLEWLLVRFHPDDPDLVLLAPVDTTPWIGTPDLALSVPWVARCGECGWFPASICTEPVRQVSASELSSVRRRLADLARGTLPPEQPGDFDPEYEEWIGLVAEAREYLENQC